MFEFYYIYNLYYNINYSLKHTLLFKLTWTTLARQVNSPKYNSTRNRVLKQKNKNNNNIQDIVNIIIIGELSFYLLYHTDINEF